MLVCADARRIPLVDELVQCVVTSPPYWGLRKYAGEQELVWGGREDCEHDFQLEAIDSEGYSGRKRWQHLGGRVDESEHWTHWHGQRGFCQGCSAWRGAYSLEPTVEMYVQHTVEILREIRRVLRKDGVLFLNIMDSYASKDLCLVPARVALAAQADGWWVRSDIIWHKPNAMPESCKDRPTDAYEHILMLTKSAKYFWDADAVREPCQDVAGYERFRASNSGRSSEECVLRQDASGKVKSWKTTHRNYATNGDRNLRNVWQFATQPYKGAHFATFPEELPDRCIRAATKRGDLVLDPFAGSGTTGRVAIALGRRAVLLDLAYTHDYKPLATERTSKVQIELLG